MPIWAGSSEKVPLRVQNVQIHAKSHPQLCSPFIHSVLSNDSVSGQQMPRSDCALAQSDLGICCRHMLENTFLYGVAHMIYMYDSVDNIVTTHKNDGLSS